MQRESKTSGPLKPASSSQSPHIIHNERERHFFYFFFDLNLWPHNKKKKRERGNKPDRRKNVKGDLNQNQSRHTRLLDIIKQPLRNPNCIPFDATNYTNNMHTFQTPANIVMLFHSKPFLHSELACTDQHLSTEQTTQPNKAFESINAMVPQRKDLETSVPLLSKRACHKMCKAFKISSSFSSLLSQMHSSP